MNVVEYQMKLSSTRKTHAFTTPEGRIDFMDIEHSASAKSRLTLKPIDVMLNNPAGHIGRHGCTASCHRFPAGSVITELNGTSAVIADGTHAFLSARGFNDLSSSHNGHPVIYQHVNTGGTIDGIRDDALLHPNSDWTVQLLMGIRGCELVRDTEDRTVLSPGDGVVWISNDIYRGVNLPPPQVQTSPSNWTASVF